MVLNLPKKNFTVRVGPYTYEVIYSADMASEGQAFGSTHNDDQKIFLDPGRPQQKIEQTFIHEVFHACTFTNGLVYRFADDDKKQPNEEDVVRELSTSFYMFIKDNPQLFSQK